MNEKEFTWVTIDSQVRSSRHGGNIVDITFASAAQGGCIAHTYIDERNRNYAHWQHIIRDLNQNQGFVLSNLGFKRRNQQVQFKNTTREPLIDADCKPRIEYTLNRTELVDRFYRILAEQ